MGKEMMADFVEVRKVIKNKIYTETIDVSDIKSFRPWQKAANDSFEGEATFLILKKSYNNHEENDTDETKKKEFPTMLIQESYADFLKRMSGRVIIMVEK